MDKQKTKINWLIISISYAIAFGISSVFNSGLLSEEYMSFTNGNFISKWTFLPAGIMTLIAAVRTN